MENLQKIEHDFCDRLINPFNQQTTFSRKRNVNMLNLWVHFIRKGSKISDYLEKIGKTNVAIYGFGLLGTFIYDELKVASKIKIDYLIDRRDLIVDDIKIYKPSSDLPKTDLIIIATSGDYDNIKEILGNNNEIITLQEILT